jgi:hypothetical protein
VTKRQKDLTVITLTKEQMAKLWAKNQRELEKRAKKSAKKPSSKKSVLQALKDLRADFKKKHPKERITEAKLQRFESYRERAKKGWQKRREKWAQAAIEPLQKMLAAVHRDRRLAWHERFKPLRNKVIHVGANGRRQMVEAAKKAGMFKGLNANERARLMRLLSVETE